MKVEIKKLEKRLITINQKRKEFEEIILKYNVEEQNIKNEIIEFLKEENANKTETNLFSYEIKVTNRFNEKNYMKDGWIQYVEEKRTMKYKVNVNRLKTLKPGLYERYLCREEKLEIKEI